MTTRLKANRGRVILLCLLIWGSASALDAQDPLAEQKIRGLEGLKEIKFLVNPNDFKDHAMVRTLQDSFELALRSKLPELKLSTTDDAEWIVLGWIVAPEAATLRLSVLRWVRLEASNKPLFATVWTESSNLYSGQVPTKTLTDAIERLV